MKDDNPGFFDKPTNVRVMLVLFFIILIGLVVVDFLFIKQHPHFVWDGAHGFFAAFGFLACVMVITISKILRYFLKREENYYD